MFKKGIESKVISRKVPTLFNSKLLSFFKSRITVRASIITPTFKSFGEGKRGGRVLLFKAF